MNIFGGFMIGLIGSLHCIGMCGPIAIALPIGRSSRGHLVAGRLLYNLGRTITYAIMGGLFGWLGESLNLGKYQQTLSVVVGVLLLLAVFLPARITSKLSPASGIARLLTRLQTAWASLFARQSLDAMLLIGILNGLLPCGLVYVALAGAAVTASAYGGFTYMAAFGVATVPVMLTVSLLGRLVGQNIRLRLRRLIPVGATVLAVILILRGMSLGIPLVSPKMTTDSAGKTVVERCHDMPADSTATDSAPAGHTDFE